MNKPGVNEAAQDLESIFAVAHDGIVFVDYEGIILRVNPAFTKIFGYEEHEILGKPFYILEYKDEVMQKNMSQQPLINFHKTEKSNLEMTLFDKQGCKVSVRFRSAFIKDKHGHNAKIIGMIERMPEQTDTDKAGDSLADKMWEAQQNFENVLNNSADAIAICDIDGNIMMVNRSFSEMLDYTQEELIGKHIVEFSAYLEGTYPTTTGDEVTIDKEYVAYTSSRPAEVYEKGYISNWEFYMVRKDKVHVPVEATMSLLKDKDGDSRGTVIIGRDITERRKAEKEVKEARDFLENIFKTSADGIVVTGDKGQITMINEAVESILGYSKDELLKKAVRELTPKGKKYEEDGKEFIEQLFEKGTLIGKERTWLKKDGSLVDVDVTVALLKDQEGNISGSVASVRDISKRKEMENKLLQSEKLKSLGELAGGVAHDFNNVLAIILGRAQLLKINIGPPPDQGERRKSIIELKKGLETIERASLDGAETVRRIQEFSRRRDDDKCFTSVDMNKIIDDALEFTKLEWKNGAESKGIKINIKKEFSTLPSVSGSAAELREVFTNIINNAIFAMPQGGTITVKSFKKGSYACIKVQDTGMGIPKAIRDRIFDPFFTTKGPQSSGLGMSVSYGIIERHRGTISVDSVDGTGTTLTIEIPFSEEKVEEGKVVPISSGQKKVNILVVEDEEDVRNLLKDVLTHEGHRVETASNGKLGIEKFKKKTFDMVLTDLGMPGISGWQVAEKIKAINGKVPIALITGWSIDLKESEMKEKGIDFILNKPYKLDQLVNVVQEGMILRERFDAG
jgi:PAS domain S-box-containing protein